MQILDPIAKVLGSFLTLIYNNISFLNYGVAIIIFTVIVKMILLPLTVKQYKSTAKIQELQPQLQEIQKRYKTDKEKLNQETMKLYSENKANPAGGCLPLLVQMPIILSLYWVIVEPLKFMLNKTAPQIDKLVSIAAGASDTVKNVANIVSQRELYTLNFFSTHKEALSQTGGLLKASELINFNFLGLHLGIKPSFDFNLIKAEPSVYIPLLLIPILGVVTTFISSKLSMPRNMNNNGSKQSGVANSMSNTMLYFAPIMTLIFTFQLPAGVGLYWIAGYIFTIFQQLYINKHILKKHEVVEVKAIEEPGGKNENEQAADTKTENKQLAGGKNSSNPPAKKKGAAKKK